MLISFGLPPVGVPGAWQVASKQTSGRHAMILCEPGACSVEDLGSLNGTFVNRRRTESTTLEDGDEIQIGKYRLTFLLH